MRPFIAKAVIVAIAAFAAAVPARAKGFVVVRKPGAGTHVKISDSLVQKLGRINGSAARVVDLSGDGVADAARVARETGDGEIVFAVGPDALVAVGEGARSHVVALGIPNPARLRTTATYVSVYPAGERVLDFVARRLGAARVGVLFSPAQNGEVAAAFGKAAAGRGLTYVPISAGSAGELVRALKEGLPKIDVLVLPVDPMLFNRMSLRLIIERCSAEKVATIGFLPELPSLGVTAALVADPDAIAAAAIREASAAGAPQRKEIEVDALQITVSRRAAEMIGLNAESLGANTIQ